MCLLLFGLGLERGVGDAVVGAVLVEAGPLPLACKTLLAYLQHLARQTDRDGEVNDDAAWQHASQGFAGGWQLPGEVDGDPCLARAFPDWPAFSLARADACTWAEQLYLPLLRATLLPPEAA